MEHETQNALDLVDRPAFLVREGVVVYANQIAKQRLVTVGMTTKEIICQHYDAYENLKEGCLYLTLQIRGIIGGATILRQEDGDIFLMDRDFDTCQLQVLALAAQQLRTPLTSMLTVSDCLLPILENSEGKEYAAHIRQNLFALMQMVSNMADAGRYNSMFEPNLEITELNRFFRELFEKADTVLENADVRVQYTPMEKGVFSLLDRELVQRAVYNLLSNAVKFSPKGSTIQAKLIRKKKYVCLSIEDQGSGLASHVKSDLFHRYLREPTIEDSRYGLGLGMTLVRSVAAIHEGMVLVDHPGGTRVTLTLAIRKSVPDTFRSPVMRISDYTGGHDMALFEFAQILPPSAFEQDI